MAVFKCKMCGGDLEVKEGSTVCECEYCGTKQTIPTTDSEKLTNLYNRANRLRFNNEFDKAAGVFENIAAEFPEESEAYWGLCLCKYGIEYVDDPTTGKKIPTCHRTSPESIFDDSNFDLAQEYADSVAQRLYREEAKEIDRLQKAILDVAKSEKPYDIFICYKETAPDGQRTKDSVMAQDICDALTAKGYKVFFARITLEDKLGQEYEPYIFAALSSARIMLSIGTSYENFNAVWVKNEWSRFLAMMKTDKSKVLIPCYCDCDAYDMPQEFRNLQGQDMGKVGFIQDLVRGIGKIIAAPNDNSSAQPQTVVRQVVSSNVDNLLKRGMMALEDEKWEEANGFFEKVLDENVEEPRAYFGKLLCSYKAKNEEELVNSALADDELLNENENYIKAYRFSDDDYKAYLTELSNRSVFPVAMKRLERAKTEKDFLDVKAIFDSMDEYPHAKEKSAECKEKAAELVYSEADKILWACRDKARLSFAGQEFGRISGYKDAAEKAAQCERKIKDIEDKENCAAYRKAMAILEAAHVTDNDLRTAVSLFRQSGWRDYQERIAECQLRIDEIRVRQNQLRASQKEEALREQQLAKKRAMKRKITVALIVIGIVLLIVLVRVTVDVVIPEIKYHNAVSLMNKGEYAKAVFAFDEMEGYKDSGLLINRLVSSSKGKISDSIFFIVAVNDDGTVTANAAEEFGWIQSDISQWNDIVAVSALGITVAGLKSDGTVVAAGSNTYGQCDVSDWSDIAAVLVCSKSIVGLKSDGTVVISGDNDWEQINVSDWSDIIAVTSGISHLVGLKSDGTVVATGRNEYGQCDVSDWNDIAAVTAGNYHTVGLKSDGTVVATGSNADGCCNVSDWTDIVDVFVGDYYTIGLKSDGTAVCTDKKLDVSGIANIKTPND